MVEWLIKKVLISKINSILKTYASSVDRAREVLKTWTSRLQKILACFESVLKKLDDGELSKEELDEAAEEAAKLVREW